MNIKLSECLDDAQLFWDWMEQEDACYDGSLWAEGRTLREAWAEIANPCWMMWLVQNSGTDLRRECTELAIDRDPGIDAEGNLTGGAEVMKAVERFAIEMTTQGEWAIFATATTTHGHVRLVASADEIRGKITVGMLVGGAK